MLTEPLVPVPTGIYNVPNVAWLVHYYLELFCQVGWSSDTQNLGESCTVLTKDNFQIWTMDSAYIARCVHVLSTFF